ncbi:MAG TPA: AAA family ATPase [Bryobacteraceae bacterium]|nr:AAA family ATPase [Bryobacteraceae bacterium]
MFIRRFSIRNFKIHKDTSLTLFPITVFVGPNSGGKSAIFDALINFSMVCRGNLSEAFNQYPYSFDALRHHGASSSARIRYEAELTLDANGKDSLDYMIEFSQNTGTNDEPTYSIHNEELKSKAHVYFSRSEDICNIPGISALHTEGRTIFGALRRAAGAGEWNDTFAKGAPLVLHCATEISRIGRYRLDPTLLAQPGRVVDIEPGATEARSYAPRVAYRGADLASVLYYLSETQSPILDRIVEIVGEAITGFAGLEFNHVGSDRIGFAARFVDKRGAVVAPNLSDGCLSMIGLVTLALTAVKPSVLCVEEPENGLTPKATRIFYRTIHALAQAEPASERTQVLLSSHSPFVIVDAWNGNERDFIYQCHPSEGMAKVAKFSEVVKEGGVLRSDGTLGLALAEQVMDGFRYQP